MSITKTNLPTCTWSGASGAGYTFYIFALHSPPRAGQVGNYIFAKRNAEGRWVPIYIGEGDLSERAGAGHHKAKCIKEKGATHFHCHLNSDVRARRAEEADLLARYKNAYKPLGCNEGPSV